MQDRVSDVSAAVVQRAPASAVREGGEWTRTLRLGALSLVQWRCGASSSVRALLFLIGIVSQADVAKNLPEDKVGDLLEAISSAPSSS